MKPVTRAFGRLIEFDERSRAWPIRALFRRGMRPRSRVWDCPIVLDQVAEGACTGFAVAHEAAADPVRVPGITADVARRIYLRARQLDDWPGEDYEGSSVLAAMKAAQERDWYQEYRWAFSEGDLALAVSTIGPAVLGINWYSGMSQPTPRSGWITPTGKLVGGHAICCVGYQARIGAYILHNSWGPSWGQNGRCLIRTRHLASLLSDQGEACIPLVRTALKSSHNTNLANNTPVN
jgi:hypothetical protein